MPITQSRLHRLLTTAEGFRLNLSHLRAFAHHQSTSLRGQLPTLQDAYNRLKLAYDDLTNEILLATGPTTGDTVLSEERMHYRLTHHSNDKKRLQLERRRRRLGIPQLPVQPISAPCEPAALPMALRSQQADLQRIAQEVAASDDALSGLESWGTPTDPPLDPADDPTQPIPGWEALRAELGLAPSGPQEGD